MIDRIQSSCLSTADFDRLYVSKNTPCHVVNLDGCPSELWTDIYLIEKMGASTVKVAFNKNGVFDYNGTQKMGPVLHKKMTFLEALSHMKSEEGGRYYIQQQNFGEVASSIELDLRRPNIIYPSDEVVARNLWLGGAATKTPLHFDSAENLLIQVRGTKRFYLYPSTVSEFVYPALGEVLPHCSNVNIFDVDYRSFPLFRNSERYRSIVTLGPNQLLYIPKGWWHAVEALTFSISVNYWWSPSLQPS